MQKRFQVFLVVSFFIALVTIVGLVYWSKGKAMQAVQNQNPPLSQSTQRHSDPTVDWKTYRNEQYGFSIQYPTEWSVLKSDNERLQVISMQNTITVSALDFRSSTATFQDWINERPYAITELKGRRALRWYTSGDNINRTEQVLIPSEDKGWAVAIDMVKSDSCDSSNCIRIFNAMVDSLSFGGVN